MSETTASPVPALAKAGGPFEREGVLVLVLAQAREGVQVREGHLCEHLQSRLRGDDLAHRYCGYCYRMITWLDRCFYIWLSPPLRWQFWMYLATT